MTHEIDTWENCYPSQWKGLIVPEAMSHPAKFSSKLIRRIYDHMVGEGWLRIGDKVIDPFGGVALGAMEAMRHGMDWTGIELELKFVELGGENIKLWNKKFGRMPHWGTARLLQGDSRKLLEVVGSARAAISSPPYADTPINQTHMTSNQRGDPNNPNYRPSWKTKLEAGFADTKHEYGSTPGQLGAMGAGDFEAALSSPPYADSDQNYKGGWDRFHKNHDPLWRNDMQREAEYGASEGQLSAMPPGDFEASISSPPFRQAEGGTPEPKEGGSIDHALYARHAAGNSAAEGYGITPGNLGNLDEPRGDFDASVSSPPYNPPMSQDHNGSRGGKRGTTPSEPGAFVKYGNTKGQLEGMDMDGFEGAVSSPPFEDSRSRDFIDAQARRDVARANGISNAELVSPIDAGRLKAPDDVYGQTDGQLGNDSGETFWSAARTIVEQVYQALAPGGHAVWVVKNYVKNKQIVPFSDQWRQLCEAVGFVTLHEHHAMLVHRKGTSHTLEGGTVEHKTESKSFFRRLAERKGSPRIDFETVFCMVKE